MTAVMGRQPLISCTLIVGQQTFNKAIDTILGEHESYE